MTGGVLATARAVRAGDLAAAEAVADGLARADAAAGLNALAVAVPERALRRARLLDRGGPPVGPLAGVPVTVKETIHLAGTPSSAGVARLAGHRAARDAPVVSALAAAGAVVVGKGNVSQLLWFAETDNPVYGRSDHPARPDRAPGGSSGGDAALVAAGVVPAAVGTDAGGSVRIPAHVCGVFGLKPTAGRLAATGMRDRDLFGARPAVPNQPGIFARSAADLAAVLDALAAGAAGDPAAPPVRAMPRVAGLRVGVFDEDGVVRPAPAVRRAVAEAARRLEHAGAHVEPFAPPDAPEARRLFDAAFAGAGDGRLRRLVGDGPVDPRVVAVLRSERAARDASGRVAAGIEAYRRRFLATLRDRRLDALLCPPYAVTAVPHGASAGVADGQSYSSLFNLTGLPAGVAPVTTVAAGEDADAGAPTPYRDVTRGSAGLPVGVQVAAAPWREDVVLALLAAAAGEADAGGAGAAA